MILPVIIPEDKGRIEGLLELAPVDLQDLRQTRWRTVLTWIAAEVAIIGRGQRPAQEYRSAMFWVDEQTSTKKLMSRRGGAPSVRTDFEFEYQ